MSPASMRSASITSSASDSAKKKFACSHPGCGKAFSRSEHLHRHSLNHKEGTNTCMRCSAHFRRRDLLDRHMTRHKEKDDAAGGEGLGVLATRKRLWRDTDGNIINGRRPVGEGTKRKQAFSQEPATQTKRRKTTEKPAPESLPSLKSAKLSTAEHNINDRKLNIPTPNSWPLNSPVSPDIDGGEQFDLFCNAGWNASWEHQQNPGSLSHNASELTYNDVESDSVLTVSSFDAAVQRSHHYDWLFENEETSVLLPQPESIILCQDRMPIISADSGCISRSHHMSGSVSPTSLDPNLLSKDSFPFSSYVSTSTHDKEQSKPNPSKLSSMLLDLPGDYSCLRAPNSASPTGYESFSMPSLTSGTDHYGSYNSDSNASSPPSLRCGSLSSTLSSPILPDAYVPRLIAKLPVITNEARDGLVQLITQSHFVRPNGTRIMSSDPLLSLLSLQHYSDLFFSRFNASYPLIHQATFRSAEVHPFLLMAILALGATYSDREAQALAQCLHSEMRPLIHASKGFGAKPPTWMLQTTLLVDLFGKSRPSEDEHDVSHIYDRLVVEPKALQ